MGSGTKAESPPCLRVAEPSAPCQCLACSGGPRQEQETFHSSLQKPLGMLHWDGEKKGGGGKQTAYSTRARLNEQGGYQGWERASEELEQAAWGLWAKAQGYAGHASSSMVPLGEPAALKALSQTLPGAPGRWQQHILAAPALEL